MNQQRISFFVLGTPDKKNFINLVEESNLEYISGDIKDIPSKNQDYTFYFFQEYSNQAIFNECEKIHFQNVAIISFYKDNEREELIKCFVDNFTKKKHSCENFPFFILLRENFEEFIENKFADLLNKYKDKIDIEKCLSKIIFALKENTLETYVSKIIHIFKAYSNLIINNKDSQRIMESIQYKSLINQLKRNPILFTDKIDI